MTHLGPDDFFTPLGVRLRRNIEGLLQQAPGA